MPLLTPQLTSRTFCICTLSHMTPAPELLQRILQRAYTLDPVSLDACAVGLGMKDWSVLTQDLEFSEHDSGGGCMMVIAPLPADHLLEITDGEADLPRNTERFYVGISNADGEERVAIFTDQHSGFNGSTFCP